MTVQGCVHRGTPEGSVRAQHTPLPPDVVTLLNLLEMGTYAAPSTFLMGEAAGAMVLFTAPHAVCHYTTTAPPGVKGADVGTGELAFAAAKQWGCAALVARSPWQGNANADPVDSCVFKQRVLHMLTTDITVKGVVDIHGMSDAHLLDVCVGSGGGGSALAEAVAGVFTTAGFNVVVDEPFSASRRGTVTREVTEAGFPAVQLELSATVRSCRQQQYLDALGPVINLLAYG
jgi:phage replication-related protein YjqB (UPF0714/DUF867 family)